MNINHIKDNNYFYLLNYPPEEKGLVALEMKALFNKVNSNKYIFSDKNYTADTSPFIKEKIDIYNRAKSFSELLDNLSISKLNNVDYKVVFLKFDTNEVSYDDRLSSLRALGMKISGTPNIKEPKIIYAVTKIEGEWIFGLYSKNSFNWHKFDKKPHSYSNSLPLRHARAICNLASKGDKSTKIIDPCCGVGTVVLNALDLGLNIKGFEILPQIACNSRNNLEYFGYKRDIIMQGDMHNIHDTYDVAILDLPYGLFTQTTFEEQKALIVKSLKISNELILITSEKAQRFIENLDCTILASCSLKKGNFIRYITIINIKL